MQVGSSEDKEWIIFSSHSSSVLCTSIFRSSPGSKAAPRPGGIGSAAAGQPGMEGEGMFSKILPGGAAEQAGKLGEGMYKCNILGGKEQKNTLLSCTHTFFVFFFPAISGIGKKFTSFF